MRCIFDDVCGDDVRKWLCFVRCDHDDDAQLDYYIYVLANDIYMY